MCVPSCLSCNQCQYDGSDSDVDKDSKNDYRTDNEDEIEDVNPKRIALTMHIGK